MIFTIETQILKPEFKQRLEPLDEVSLCIGCKLMSPTDIIREFRETTKFNKFQRYPSLSQ